jgi:hypothetical protein
MPVQVNLIVCEESGIAYLKEHVADVKKYNDTSFYYVQRTMPIPRIGEHIVLNNIAFRVRDVVYKMHGATTTEQVAEIKVLMEAE